MKRLKTTIAAFSLLFITSFSFSIEEFCKDKTTNSTESLESEVVRIYNQDDSIWQFKAGNTTYSGTIDKAFISPDKSSLYFWGASHQSPGTIISVVANFRSKFIASIDDASSTDISFIFGKSDNSELPILTIDPTSTEFVVIVKNYNHQTKVAHGTISGMAKDSNGKDVEIKNGKFRVQL